MYPFTNTFLPENPETVAEVGLILLSKSSKLSANIVFKVSDLTKQMSLPESSKCRLGLKSDLVKPRKHFT